MTDSRRSGVDVRRVAEAAGERNRRLSVLRYRRCPRIGLAAAALLLIGHGHARAQERLQATPALQPALTEMKRHLDLSDDQVGQVEGLLAERYGRIKAFVDEFGGVSFDSVVDVLVEARSVRDEFVPALKGVLNDEQRARLGQLPKEHEVYVAAVGGWLAEAYLDKVGRRVDLSGEQVGELRPVILDRFRDAVSIVEGLVGDGGKKAILDAVVDLRGVQRQTRRDVEKRLNAEQRAKLEALRAESDAVSLEKGRKGAAEAGGQH